MTLRDISYACMQASPDLAHGARVQSIGRLEENRQKKLGARLRFLNISRFLVVEAETIETALTEHP